ncbi:MAG TPA: ComEC/Rec2 family competence protein [Devosiaceae bacterium]
MSAGTLQDDRAGEVLPRRPLLPAASLPGTHPQGRFRRIRASFEGAFADALTERRLFVLMPALMIAGAMAYRAAGFEPQPWAPPIIWLTLFVALVASRRKMAIFRWLLVGMAFWTGFTLIAAHGQLFGTTMLQTPRYGIYTAHVDEVSPGGGDTQRLVISGLSGLQGGRAVDVRRARISVSASTEIAAGDTIEGAIRFYPVPGPVRPGGYDPQFSSYFAGIGAYGAATGTLKVMPRTADAFPMGLIANLRATIGQRIDAALSVSEGAIARAVTIGDQSRIDEATRNVMAAAGLAHVLAISGLHLSLVAGGAFAVLRALLALSHGLTLRADIRRIAALGGAMVALTYLMLSGGGVSAVRATLMLLLMFGAMLAGRRALTMRNVAMAAMAVILLSPESVFQPGFQLSFAAVVGLIGVYEFAGRSSPRWGRIDRMVRWLRDMAVTSLVAGGATALFAVYHFQQAAPLGVLANIVVVPLVGSIILPSAILGVLLIPLGYSGPAFKLMGWGIDRMLDTAHVVAGWSGVLPGPPLLAPVSLAIGLAALAWFAFLRNRWRFVGPLLAIPMVMGFGIDVRPDLLVADNSKAVAVRGEQGMALATGRRASFAPDAWSDAYREPILDHLAAEACDASGCFAHGAGGFTVAIVEDLSAFAEDCRSADLVIARLPAPAACRGRTTVIDTTDLARDGAEWLRWDPVHHSFSRRSAITDVNRPWRGALR